MKPIFSPCFADFAAPANGRRCRVARLVPLLLALAVSQAYAVDIALVGADGAAGAPGVPGKNGGNGAAGALLIATVGQNTDAYNKLWLNGGFGGAGGDASEGDAASTSGAGGAGGMTVATAISAPGAGQAQVTALTRSWGGWGNNGGSPYDPSCYQSANCRVGAGGDGGFASSTSLAIGTGAADVLADALAVGGDAGNSWAGGNGGVGGGATASAYGRSDTGNVTVIADANGGASGSAAGQGLVGAGVQVRLTNAVSGATRGSLALVQGASGGAGGTSAYPGSAAAGHGGDAWSTLAYLDAQASALSGEVRATGGSGGYGYQDAGGNGGAAHAALDLSSTRAGATVEGSVRAIGAAAGGSLYTAGAGGSAEATLTLSGLGLVSGSALAQGGVGGYTQEAVPGARGGDASARATLAGLDAVRGVASATGGDGTQGLYPGAGGGGGNAYASLTLSSAGAVNGTSTALGGYAGDGAAGGSANSTVRGVSRGAGTVEVQATALARGNGSATVNAYGASAGGAVTVSALASGGQIALRDAVSGRTSGALSLTQSASANSVIYQGGSASSSLAVDDRRASSLTASVSALGGGSYTDGFDPVSGGGDGTSELVLASTRAGTAVSGSAQAAGGSADFGGQAYSTVNVRALGAASGTSVAVGGGSYNQSGFCCRQAGTARSGAAVVSERGPARADSRAEAGFAADGIGGPDAEAWAESSSLLRGGASYATAAASGSQIDVLARARGVDDRLANLSARADGRTTRTGIAVAQTTTEARAASASVQAWRSGASSIPSVALVASAALHGEATAPGQLAGGELAWSSVAVPAGQLGGGAMAVGAGAGDGAYNLRGEFAFTLARAGHLLLDWSDTNAVGNGFDWLSLQISTYGAGTLFQQTFYSLAEADQFFNGAGLDLGVFGSGQQDLRINATLGGGLGNGFAFHYALSGVAGAVPEPGQWLMLLIGGALLLVVRSRAGQLPSARQHAG